MSSNYQGLASNVTFGLTATINAATNASPIVCTTSASHNFASGDSVYVYGATGNTAANGLWTITVLSATTFSLTGSTGNGTFTGTATAADVSLTPYGTIPSDGDPPTAASVNVMLQLLADRTQFLSLSNAKNLTIKSQAFTANGNFTVPLGCTSLLVYAFGGGGGGGQGGIGDTNTAAAACGGGGGAGAIASTRLLTGVKPGDVVAVAIGAGGSGAGSQTNDGGTGGTTSVGSLSFLGGAGGSTANTVTVNVSSAVSVAFGGCGPGVIALTSLARGNLFVPLTFFTSSAGYLFSPVGPGAGAPGFSSNYLSPSGTSSLEGFSGGTGGAIGTTSGGSYRGGGGGGGGGAGPRGAGGAGGTGGNGSNTIGGSPGVAGSAAAANTGGGGGGGGAGGQGASAGGSPNNGGAGGSGYALIMYVSAA